MVHEVYDEMEDMGLLKSHRYEETHIVETPHGPITVSVEPGCDIKRQKDKQVILTYHDIGTNHLTCFGSFFSLDECQIFKDLFLVLHIDAPGHEVGCKEAIQADRLTLDMMGEQVGYVVKHFGLDEKYNRIYGFGVGAGASVLLNYATFDANQARFAGMWIVNGSGSQPGWREWAWNSMLSSSLKMQGMSHRTKRALLYRMFTSDCIENNEDLVEEYCQVLDEMHAGNVKKYVDAYAKRRDVTDEIDAIACFDVILFAGGDNSDFTWHTKELNKMFELGRSTYLDITECAMLVTEEGPHHMANPIKYYLGGKGFLLESLDMKPNRPLE